MFEKIVLRKSQNQKYLSTGTLAEALLFYQNVHIFLDYSTFMHLSQKIGLNNLINLLSRPNVTAVFCEQTLATQTERIAGIDFHNFRAITLDGDKDSAPLASQMQRLEFYIKRLGYSHKQAEKLADKLSQKMAFRRITNDYFIKGGVINAATEDILKKTFSKKAFRAILSTTSGFENIDNNTQIEIKKFGLGLIMESGIDFDLVNQIRKTTYGLDPISPANLLTDALEAVSDTILAAKYGGEFQTNNTSSLIIKARYSDLTSHFDSEKNEIEDFQEITLPNMPKLSDVIDNDERSFDEFLKVLDKAQKFQAWLKKSNPDAKLIQEYTQAITSTDWLDSLPSKSLRYVFNILASVLTTPATGAVLSAVDTFLLDRIIRGWRPNHFIDERLKPFIQKRP